MVEQALSFIKLFTSFHFKIDYDRQDMVGQVGIGNGMSLMKLIEWSLLWCINSCNNVVLNLLNHGWCSLIDLLFVFLQWMRECFMYCQFISVNILLCSWSGSPPKSWVIFFWVSLSRLCANKKVSLSWLFLGVLWKQSKSAVHKVGEVNHVLLFAFLRRFLYWSEANL